MLGRSAKNMKSLAFIYLLLLAGVLLYSWGSYPIMKMPTDEAVRSIENNFLRKDLTLDEQSSFDFYSRWIRGNQDGVSRAFSNASSAISLLFYATLILNIYNLVTYLKKRNETQ